MTDNGKVFTGRFGPGTGEVLFDRICRENGIGHLLTAPRSPTTTGKVERFHKTLRGEFLDGKVFARSTRRSRARRWVHSYNYDRPIKASGWSCRGSVFVSPTPSRDESPVLDTVERADSDARLAATARSASPVTTIRVGVWLAGETVEVSVEAGLITSRTQRGARRDARSGIAPTNNPLH